MQSKLTIFNHPISVLFLDDNKNFLTLLELELATSLEPYADTFFCATPEEAYKLIQLYCKRTPNIFKSNDKTEVDTITLHQIDMDVGKLHTLIYEANRFKQIAIIIVDYQMPMLNGVDFCRSVLNKSLYKIMLTMQADKNVAVQAFNEGIINKFFLKKNENLYIELVNAIKDLANQHFEKLSSFIIEGLGAEFKKLFYCDEFFKIFNSVKQQFNAIEYYLVDSSGSFLFLDEKANPTWLIIRSEKEILEQISILEGLEAPKSIVSSLKKREEFLFMPHDNDYKKPIKEWSSFLFESKKLNKKYN